MRPMISTCRAVDDVKDWGNSSSAIIRAREHIEPSDGKNPSTVPVTVSTGTKSRQPCVVPLDQLGSFLAALASDPNVIGIAVGDLEAVVTAESNHHGI